MDRELVFLVLALLVVTPALLAVGVWRAPWVDCQLSQLLEGLLWKRLWATLIPAAFLLALLTGWAFAEPENAERLPWGLRLCATPFGLVWLRAIVRALAALRSPGRDLPAITRGIFFPRSALSAEFVASVDADALRAAQAHEAAHARHFDPFRIWVAQIATDLQWPCAGASSRFEQWLGALEMARDEEARRGGVDGADLAQAVLVAARITGRGTSGVALASLGGRPADLQARVARLLEPLPLSEPQPSSRASLALLGCGLASMTIVGATWGEVAMRTLLHALR